MPGVRGLGEVMGSSLGVGSLLRGFDETEMGLHVGEVGTGGEGGHQRGIGGERVQADPGIDRCASP